MKPQERVNAILKSRLEPSCRLLLVSIASHMSDGNLQTWIAPDTMVEETGLSRSTVMSLLASLTAAGVLTRSEEGHRAKTTRIVWEALAAYQPATTKRGGSRVQSDNRTVESEDRTPEMDCTKTEQGSEHRTEGSDNRTPKSPIIGPDPIMIRPMIRPVDPGGAPAPSTADLQQPEPEPDWEAIAAATLKARDAEIDSYFASPIEPPPPPPIPARIQPRAPLPTSPSMQESLARIREAIMANPAPLQPEPPPQRAAPVEDDLGPSPVAGMDLPTLLGSGAASQRLLRALVAGGLTTAEALERVTFDDLKFMPGVSTAGANTIREALGKHGAALAMDKGRLLLLCKMAADHPKPWPPEVTRADKVALKAARVRWRALAEADDFRITDIYRAIEAGRRV